MTTEQQAPAAPAPSSRSGLDSGRDRRRGWLSFLRDVLIIVLVAVLVSFLVKTFLVRSFYIPSGSMESTLLVNDRILVDEITPRFGGYDRGDIVVFRDPGGWLPVRTDPPRSPIVEAIDWSLSLVGLSAPDSDDHLVKRIIGMPGDHVVCCNTIGQITSTTSRSTRRTTCSSRPPTAPHRRIRSMSRSPRTGSGCSATTATRSKDSRYNQEQPGKGFVPIENVVGRAFLITWPFDRFGMLDFHHERVRRRARTCRIRRGMTAST